jgi:hypothetical protein
MSISTEEPKVLDLDKARTYPHWKDRYYCSILKENLLMKLQEIKNQQGFCKNEQDIISCINFIDRSYLPVKYITGRVKSVRKLHLSLKLYLRDLGLIFFDLVRKNYQIFHNYTFFEKSMNIYKECKNTDVKEILSVNLTEQDLKSVNSTFFKNKEFHFENHKEEDEICILDSETKTEIRKYYKENCKGAKYIQRDCSFLVKLKKKYKTEDDLWVDLYKIFINWYNSKIKSHERHIHIHNRYMESHWLTGNGNRENRSFSHYFLDIDMMKSLVKKESQYPKRFRRIITTIRRIYQRKSLKNNTYLDDIITKIVNVVEDKKDSMFVPGLSMISKYKANAKFYNWVRTIIKDLIKKDFLNEYDIPDFPGKRYKYGCSITITDLFVDKQLRDQRLLKRFVARSDKYYNQIKILIIKNAIKDYLEEEDVSKYLQLIDGLKGRLRGLFSSGVFKQDLLNFVLRDTHIEESPEIPVVSTYTNELLVALCKDRSILQYLDKEDMKSLKLADDNYLSTDVKKAMEFFEYSVPKIILKSLSEKDKRTSVLGVSETILVNGQFRERNLESFLSLEYCLNSSIKFAIKNLDNFLKRNMINKDKPWFKTSLKKLIIKGFIKGGLGQLTLPEKVLLVRSNYPLDLN